MADDLVALLEGIKRHAALNNRFYQTWTQTPQSIDALKIFARNYSAWVVSFPDTLAVLVFSTADHDAKVEYAKTLYSELGYGSADKAHSVLLANFLRDLGARMDVGSPLASPNLERDTPVLRTTHDLLEGERRLYGHENRLIAVGAQLALEWQAYTMLRKLYDGARLYAPLWDDEDEFHEACEYFYVHIGAAEKDHKAESISAVRRYLDSRRAFEIVAAGYHEHLDLIARFWNGIHCAMDAGHFLTPAVSTRPLQTAS